MLTLIDEIGRGKERTCFLHPQDSHKIIKIVHGSESKQMEREIQIYRHIAKKTEINYKHFPKFYGELVTDKGIGYVFDLVTNFDGSVSRSLHSYLKCGFKIDDFYPQLSELRSYLLVHSVVFCNDMSYEGNILVKESADGTSKLVVIDGLGDVIYIKWINKVDFLLKRKIKRRWSKLIQRLKKANKTMTS